MIHPTIINGVRVFKQTDTEFYFKTNPVTMGGPKPPAFLLRDGELVPVDAVRQTKIIGPGLNHGRRGRRRGRR